MLKSMDLELASGVLLALPSGLSAAVLSSKVLKKELQALLLHAMATGTIPDSSKHVHLLSPEAKEAMARRSSSRRLDTATPKPAAEAAPAAAKGQQPAADVAAAAAAGAQAAAKPAADAKAVEQKEAAPATAAAAAPKAGAAAAAAAPKAAASAAAAAAPADAKAAAKSAADARLAEAAKAATAVKAAAAPAESHAEPRVASGPAMVRVHILSDGTETESRPLSPG